MISNGDFHRNFKNGNSDSQAMEFEIADADGRIYLGRRIELRLGKFLIGFDINRRVR